MRNYYKVKLRKKRISLKQFSKYFSVILCLLLLVFVIIPLFFFFYLFNENHVRKVIISQFNNVNYQVAVNGNIRPNLQKWLSLDINNLDVSSKPGSALLHINKINCQFSWLSLILGNYKIKKITLDGIDIHEKNIIKYGINNLINTSQLHKASFNQIQKISINDFKTIGDDLRYRISDGSLNIEHNAGQAKFKIGFKLAQQNTYIISNGSLLSIDNNRVKFANFTTNAFNKNTKIMLTSEASFLINEQKLILNQTQGSINFNGYFGTIDATELKFSINGAEATNLILNLNRNNEIINQNFVLMIDRLQSKNFNELGIDQLKLQYNAAMNKNLLKIDAVIDNLNVDKDTHITSRDCMSQLSFNSPTLNGNGIQAKLGGVCEYIGAKNLIDLNLSGNIDQAPLKLALQIYNSNNKKPYIVASGIMDALDLSRFQVDKDKLLPLYYDNSQLPFAWLSVINMDANLNIKHFALDRITLNNVSTQFKVANNELKINKMVGDLYNGKISGKATVSQTSDGYNISTIQNIKNLELQKMFEDLFDVKAISGKAHLYLNIYAKKVSSYNDIHKSLNGEIAINATHGAFRGVDFNLFVNPDSIHLSSEKSTMFDNLATNFNFIDGISRAGKINFSSLYVIANGVGDVDFIHTKVKYNLAIKSALPKNNQKISSVLIPVSVSGNLFNPNIIIQNVHLFKQQVIKPIMKPTNKLKKAHNKIIIKHKVGKLFKS